MYRPIIKGNNKVIRLVTRVTSNKKGVTPSVYDIVSGGTCENWWWCEYLTK